MTKRVLITGASGLIGRYVTDELASDHHLILSSRGRFPLPADFSHSSFDISRTDEISPWLSDLSPEVIVHTAAVTSIAEASLDTEYTRRVNVEAPREIAMWCAANNARLVHFSTDFIFDGTRRDWKETDQAGPLSDYGRSKLESEKAVLSTSENTVVIRPILVYGYHADLVRPNFPILVAEKLSRGDRMSITSDQYRMPTYAGDLSRAVASLIDHSFTGVLHLCGPDYLNIMEFATLVAERFDLDPELLTAIETVVRDGEDARPMISGFDTSLAANTIDWDPQPISATLDSIRSIYRK